MCVCCVCVFVCLSQSKSVFGANCTNDDDCSYGKVFRNGHGKRRSLTLIWAKEHNTCWWSCVHLRLWQLTHSVAGVATGKCNTTTSTCMVYAWCPVEEEDDKTTYVCCDKCTQVVVYALGMWNCMQGMYTTAEWLGPSWMVQRTLQCWSRILSSFPDWLQVL